MPVALAAALLMSPMDTPAPSGGNVLHVAQRVDPAVRQAEHRRAYACRKAFNMGRRTASVYGAGRALRLVLEFADPRLVPGCGGP